MSRKDPSLSSTPFVESWVQARERGGAVYIESWRPDCQRRARARVEQLKSATRNTRTCVTMHTGPSARVQVDNHVAGAVTMGTRSVRGLLIRVAYESERALPPIPVQDRRPLPREGATC
jgi:hypothetical protein